MICSARTSMATLFYGSTSSTDIGMLGARLFDALAQWLGRRAGGWSRPATTAARTLASKEFERLNARVLRLDKDFTTAELDRMRRLYGDVRTTTSIGFHPPLRKASAPPGAKANRSPDEPQPDTSAYARAGSTGARPAARRRAGRARR